MKNKLASGMFKCACVSVLSVSLAFAAEGAYTLRDGVEDWTVPESYVENAVPAAGALVNLPSGCTVTLDSTDTESWELAESFARIVPEDSTSRLVVNVVSNEASLTVPFSASNVITAGYDKGMLEKTGEGELFLAGLASRFTTVDGGARCDHMTSVTVSGGTLTLPQAVTNGASFRFGHVTVAEGAVFTVLAVAPEYRTNVWPSVHFMGLSGKGTVSSSGTRPLQIAGVSRFEGRFSGTLDVFVNSWVTLSGSESDTTGKVVLRLNYGNLLAKVAPGGILYADSFGMAGEPSPIGSADTIETGDFGGGLVYMGSGETCDKNFHLADPVANPGLAFIDGGPYGGLEWSGAWKQTDYSSSLTKAHRIIITGTNSNECVMSGVIKDGFDDDVYFPITVIKRGTGTWRMAHNDGRTGGGVYSVEAGTLRYDSIAERGEPSALGASDNLVRHGYTGRDIESNRVDYAFLLGSAKGATMEFTGSANVKCSTRPVAVNGKARFKVSGSGTYSFSGFYAESSGAELVIDTDRTDGYVWLGGFRDGAAPLPVIKEGAGEIKISSGMDFTGPLSVKEGTLTLCATNHQYGWFRWIVKEKGVFCDRYEDIRNEGWPDTPDLKMEEFALFDADGKRIDKGLSYHSEFGAFHLMAEGSIAEEDGWFYDFWGDTQLLDRSKITTLFDGGAGSRSGVWGGVNIRSVKWPFCRPDSPEYWFRLIERLPADSKPAASFDLACFYGSESSNKGMVARGVTAIAIEGSVDGVNWEPVVENNALEIPPEGPRWYANTNSALVSVSGADYTLKEHTGFPMRGFSTNGVLKLSMPVSVAPGATLRADGDVAISSLVLSKSGNGVIDGVSFASQGSLSVDIGDDTRGLQTLPVEIRNCAGLDNFVKWDLSVNGGTSRGRKIRVTESGAVELVPPALVIVIK